MSLGIQKCPSCASEKFVLPMAGRWECIECHSKHIEELDAARGKAESVARRSRQEVEEYADAARQSDERLGTAVEAARLKEQADGDVRVRLAVDVANQRWEEKFRTSNRMEKSIRDQRVAESVKAERDAMSARIDEAVNVERTKWMERIRSIEVDAAAQVRVTRDAREQALAVAKLEAQKLVAEAVEVERSAQLVLRVRALEEARAAYGASLAKVKGEYSTHESESLRVQAEEARRLLDAERVAAGKRLAEVIASEREEANVRVRNAVESAEVLVNAKGLSVKETVSKLVELRAHGKKSEPTVQVEHVKPSARAKIKPPARKSMAPPSRYEGGRKGR